MFTLVVGVATCGLQSDSEAKIAPQLSEEMDGLQLDCNLFESALDRPRGDRSLFESFLLDVLYSGFQQTFPRLVGRLLKDRDVLTPNMKRALELASSTSASQIATAPRKVLCASTQTDKVSSSGHNTPTTQDTPPMNARRRKLVRAQCAKAQHSGSTASGETGEGSVKRKRVEEERSKRPPVTPFTLGPGLKESTEAREEEKRKTQREMSTELGMGSKIEAKRASKAINMSDIKRRTAALYRGSFGSRVFVAHKSRYASPNGVLSETLMHRLQSRSSNSKSDKKPKTTEPVKSATCTKPREEDRRAEAAVDPPVTSRPRKESMYLVCKNNRRNRAEIVVFNTPTRETTGETQKSATIVGRDLKEIFHSLSN